MSQRDGIRRRLALGTGTLVLAAIPARRSEPPKLETLVFETINGLPDGLLVPLWPVMQLGGLVAVPVAAGIAVVAGQPALGRRMFSTGTTTWLVAKGVKRAIGRGRPKGLVPRVRVRGQAASGEGFLSGHAGIATALALAAMPMDPLLRPTLVAVAATVGVARIYVGAHMPLDVVGGAALAVVVDAGFSWLSAPEQRRPRVLVAALVPRAPGLPQE